METNFIYDLGKVNSGSTILRGFNIAKALGWKIVPFDSHIRNKRLIILKQSNYSKLIDLVKYNEIVIDMIDFEFPERKFKPEIFSHFDYGIFSCQKQLELYSHGFKYPERCKVIYHHWDEKLKDIRVKDLDEVKIGYFGASNKCHLFGRIKSIDYHITKTSHVKYFDSILNYYPDYNVHFIMKRPDQENKFGSLLKLANASALGCPVITSENGYNELLGMEYPFYCPSFNMADVIATIENVKSNFKTKKWNLAIKILAKVKDKTSIQNIVKEYLFL